MAFDMSFHRLRATFERFTRHTDAGALPCPECAQDGTHGVGQSWLEIATTHGRANRLQAIAQPVVPWAP